MATNVCLNPPVSNEVARQGLTDMYLPTLKLREARSPTYWAITESNHQSNINLLAKPSPREYNPKAVDYNSPYGVDSYIARPAQSSVANVMPANQNDPRSRPGRLSSADIPNISVNAADSMSRGDDIRSRAMQCTQMCCGDVEDRIRGQDYRGVFGVVQPGEVNIDYGRKDESRREQWPGLSLENQNMPMLSQETGKSTMCCPGLFGDNKTQDNAWRPEELPLAREISYTRPSHEEKRAAGDQQTDQNSFNHSATPGNQTTTLPSMSYSPSVLPGRATSGNNWHTSGGPSPIDMESSIDFVSSQNSECNFGKPSTENMNQINQSTSRPTYSPQRTRGNSSSPQQNYPSFEAQKRPAPPQQQASDLHHWGRMNTLDSSHDEIAGRIANARDCIGRPASSAFGLCSNQAAAGEGKSPWQYSTEDYKSPEGVVNPPLEGPSARQYKPICGSSVEDYNTWNVQDDVQLTELPEMHNESRSPTADFPDARRMIETVEIGAVNNSGVRGCCEADFIPTEYGGRRISEPTNRIIQAVSPRGLCVPDPSQVKKILHLEHYDVVQ